MTRLLAVAFAGGAWLLQQQAQLWSAEPIANAASAQPGAWAYLALLAGLPIIGLLAWRRRGALRVAALVALFGAAGFAWAHWRAEQRLADALPAAWEGPDLVVVGVVRGLPFDVAGFGARGLRFAFEIERVETTGAVVPRRISLSWYGRGAAQPMPALEPGERWRLQVRLRRPHGSANPYGFDVERWLLEQGFRATGSVRTGAAIDTQANTRLDAFVVSPASMVDRARHRIAEHIRAALPGAMYAEVMVALVVGEQRGIATEDWTLFNRTGIGHLLSISGLHITMLAALVAALAARIWRHAAVGAARWPGRISAPQTAALAGVCAAFVYTLLAGFAVPAQRTLWMLAVVAAALFLQRGFRPSHVLGAALALVVALDPWAVAAPGFWLSFGAVAALMFASMAAGRAPAPAQGWRARARTTLREAVRAQLAVTLALVPLTLLFFQQVSVVGPLANAVAIPVVSFIVTPLALLGGLVGTVFGLAWPLAAAHVVFAWLAIALQWLAQWPAASLEWPAPGMWPALAALLGLAWLAAPRAVPARVGGVALLVPMALTQHPMPPEGVFRATVLDVGQGMAVLIETARHRLLYDTGPRYTEEADAGNRVLVPHLRAIGARHIDGMVISHLDQDHSGGAQSVLTEREVGWVLSPLTPQHGIVAATRDLRACVRGLRWQWDGVEFEVLHPSSRAEAGSGHSNGGSCVLRVAAGARALLMAGDIEAAQEAELLARKPARLRADALLVPHHGSASSSSAAFVAAVGPRVAVFQVGYRNRFGHPRAEVLERYADSGTQIARSDRDGAIMLEVSAGELRWTSWRAKRPRYWQTMP